MTNEIELKKHPITGEIVLESWMYVCGFDGLYEVSNYGRVKSLKTGRIISLRKSDTGYLNVGMRKNSKEYAKNVHRIVAEAFIPNPENFRCVLHIDSIKRNNFVFNLKWGTHSENTRQAINDGLMKPYWKGKTGKNHFRSRKVVAIKDLAIMEFDSQKECAQAIGRSRRAVDRHVLDGRECNGFKLYSI